MPKQPKSKLVTIQYPSFLWLIIQQYLFIRIILYHSIFCYKNLFVVSSTINEYDKYNCIIIKNKSRQRKRSKKHTAVVPPRVRATESRLGGWCALLQARTSKKGWDPILRSIMHPPFTKDYGRSHNRGSKKGALLRLYNYNILLWRKK